MTTMLRVGRVPGRKSPALYAVADGQAGDIEVLGFVKPGLEDRVADLLGQESGTGDLQWKAHGDTRQYLTAWPDGPLEVVYLRSPDSAEGGHQITWAGRMIRVLPDGQTTGQKRSHIITDALTDLQVNPDPLTYLIGAFIAAGVDTIQRWDDQ